MFVHKIIKVPLYHIRLCMMVSDDPEKIEKIIPEFDREYVFAHTLYSNYKGEAMVSVVLNMRSKWNITHGVIAHEAHHAVSYIFDYIGANYDITNDEPAAYLLSWIVDQIYEFLSKNKFVEK